MPPRRRHHSRHAGLPGAVNEEVISEEAANAILAHPLRDQGIAAQAEGRSPDTTPHIRVTQKTGDTVLLERQ